MLLLLKPQNLLTKQLCFYKKENGTDYLNILQFASSDQSKKFNNNIGFEFDKYGLKIFNIINDRPLFVDQISI